MPGNPELNNLIGKGVRPPDKGDAFTFALGQRERLYPRLNSIDNGWFSRTLQPHLLGAHYVWQDVVKSQLSTDLQGAFDEIFHTEERLGFIADAWWKVVVANDPSGESELLKPLYQPDYGINLDSISAVLAKSEYAFSAQVWMPEVDWNRHVLIEAMEGWRQLLEARSWMETEAKTGVPYMVELHVPASGIPFAMLLGGMPFELRLGRFLVPSEGIRRYPYSMRLFDYIGMEYEQISDMKFKNEVFLALAGDLFRNLRYPAARILDLGVGTGAFGGFLDDMYVNSVNSPVSQWELCGVDFSERMCKVARERRSHSGQPLYHKVWQTDIGNMAGIEDNSVDAAIMSFVEIWLDDNGLVKVLSEVKRVLKPGGYIIFNLHKPKRGRIEDLREAVKGCGMGVDFPEELCETNNSKIECITFCRAYKGES